MHYLFSTFSIPFTVSRSDVSLSFQTISRTFSALEQSYPDSVLREARNALSVLPLPTA